MKIELEVRPLLKTVLMQTLLREQHDEHAWNSNAIFCACICEELGDEKAREFIKIYEEELEKAHVALKELVENYGKED